MHFPRPGLAESKRIAIAFLTETPVLYGNGHAALRVRDVPVKTAPPPAPCFHFRTRSTLPQMESIVYFGLLFGRGRHGTNTAEDVNTIYFNRFAAIDFETADYGKDSACALAIVIGEKGKIVTTCYALIRPPRRHFQFTWLHGIGWDDVAEQPVFGELWLELAPLFNGIDFIAAHNASFDRGVLTACCEQAGFPPPDLPYLCTMRLARQLWDIRPTRLSDVCHQFSIPLDHHNAESDATACAKIALRAWHGGVPQKAFLKSSLKVR